MNDTLKKVFAVLVIIIIAFGWYWSVAGIGSVGPLKDKIKLGLDIKGGVYVVLEAQTNKKGEKLKDLMEQTQAVIEGRVNQMGLAEPVVTIEGNKRIRVELPGVEDAEEAIEEIGKTAQLKFTMADGSFVLDGAMVKDAVTQQDKEAGGYAVGLEFDKKGAKRFEAATEKAMSGTVTPTIDKSKTEDGYEVLGDQILIWLDNQIISHPQVNEVISGGQCEITGSFTQEEATNLAALIRGGALPVELTEVTSSAQTAKIGFNALEMSVYAGLIGIAIIMVIMLVGYRIMGVAADIALALYVVLIVAAMALIGSTLTLPGIAGIVLSIGMAVDANIIIFTRIKEEIVNGRTIRAAVKTGFKRAMSTVVDSQVTTLIAAVILYQVGTSSVKGFAWTLMLGIIASIFTAVVVTQLYLNIIAGTKAFGKNKFFGIKDDGTIAFGIKRYFPFIKRRKIFYVISVAVIAAGFMVGGIRGLNYGIDFTGGTMMQFDMGRQVATEEVKDVMKNHDIDVNQMEVVFSGDNKEEVVIRTNEALENRQRAVVSEDFQKTFDLTEDDVLATELFGPSVGRELRNNAIKAILLAAVGMLIYIRLRFRKWKFGAAALAGVVHDVLWVLAFYAIFQVTVNNPFIAAILTVVGYSINDTIVVFDRIRENNRFMRKESEEEIIDASINQTLTRSVMTSMTTLIVLIPLYIMTTSSIREFVLPLMVGIIVGMLSSIFVCSPLYYEFSKLGSKKHYKSAASKGSRKKKYEKIESTKKRPERKPVEEAPEEAVMPEKEPEEVEYIVEIEEEILPEEQAREGQANKSKKNKNRSGKNKKGKKKKR